MELYGAGIVIIELFGQATPGPGDRWLVISTAVISQEVRLVIDILV